MDWNDLAKAKLEGRGLPGSATDTRVDRQRSEAISELVTAGLRWAAVDLGAYSEEALTELRRQLGGHIVAEQTFEQGDGVLVLTIE
jgi:hypothetical protein